MSETPHVQRCTGWIREQIESLATLRTANTRDQSFRNWRQNTVTVLQRIWPEDRERVERFRRIAFTPPQSKADARATREWFGKGIGESRAYLNMLLEVIEREGVPAPAEADRERDAESLESDVAFPLLDLSAPVAAGASSGAAAPAASAAGGLDVTSGYASADDQGARPSDPAAPAPPALNMDWNAAPSGDAPHAGTSAAEAPPALGESGPGAGAANDDRPPVEIPLAPTLAGAAASEAKPAAGAAEAAAGPAEQAAAAAETPTREMPTREMPSRETPSRETPSRVIARLRGKHKSKKPAPKGKLKDMLGLADFESRMVGSAAESEAAEPVAPPPAAEPAPAVAKAPVESPAEVVEATGPAELAAASADDSGPPAPPAPADAEARRAAETAAGAESDEADRERATLDFLRSSPVLGLVGKPVQRRADAGAHSDPDAVAIAALAGDLAPLGVPEGMRTSLAARLNDVAKHVEAADLDWPLLRGCVTDAMQYPELARRLLPVLLPWLERAA